MKSLILVLLAVSSISKAEWTDKKPLKGIVKSFDKECVEIKGPDGKVFSVSREPFSDVKLESGVTEVPYHEDAIKAHPCERKK